MFGTKLKRFMPGSEFETRRQTAREFFATFRDSMDRVNRIAASLRVLTGQEPAGMNRLTSLIDEARTLEESVFRHWPSLDELPLEGNAISVDESLAEMLGISVELARQRMDQRRSRLKAASE